MKALIFRETGEPKSVLKLAEIPTPPLAPGEALVRVLLSPINPSDLHMVRGRYGYQPELPASPGAEGVGIVEAVGPGVQGPIVGTRVVFVQTWNTWREQIVCPVDRLVPVPDGLDDPAAATSYTNPLTAWALTRSSHNLKEGDWLLQTAAASSVGKLVLQLAQQYRFKTINVIRRREQETIIRNLGGNEVICTADEDLRSRLQELTAGKGIERAIDCVAGDLGAEIARRAAAVLHDDRLVPVGAEAVRHHASDDVGRASGRIADQHPHGADGILLGVRCERSRKRAENNDATAKHHVISPKNLIVR